MDEYPDYGYDDFDGLPTVLDVPAERLSVEELRNISDAARGSSPLLYSPAKVPHGRPQAMIPNRQQPSSAQPSSRGASSKSTPPPRVAGGSCSSSSGGAWSAAAWSAGAPPSVHSSPAEPLKSRQPQPSSAKKGGDPSPRPRTGVPQPTGVPPPPALHEQGKATHADARASAAAFAAAAAMGVSPRTCLPSSSSSSGGFGGGGTSTSTSRVGASPGRVSGHQQQHHHVHYGPPHDDGSSSLPLPGMAPPKETPRERRLQQQRDALSQAVSIAQSAAAEAAVNTELLKGELYLAEDQTSRMSALVAGGQAERAALRSQLDALAAELRIARAANERLSADRLHSGVSASVVTARERHLSPAQARLREAEEAKNRLRPDYHGGGRGGGVGGRGRGRGRGGAGGVGSGAMVVHGGRGGGGGSRSAPRDGGYGGYGVQTDSMTQTAGPEDEQLNGGSPDRSPGRHRIAQAEVQGLKAELAALKEQVAEAAARRKAELEGGEKAHAAAMAAHGTSALHARLLWTEAHQLEEALAEAGAALAKERRESHHALKEKESIIAELRSQLQQQETLHQQQLSRARADHRVLHRNTREYRESKNAVERQRDALEEQLATYEETRSALMREQKEKARILKHQASELHEYETRVQSLERSLNEARKAQKSGEDKAEKAAKQGRADREVLVECVRQMASQLAAARAATEAANNQLIIVQGESAGRLKELETASSNESAKVQALQAQVAECERQLQAEVEKSQTAAEASAATLRRAAQREAELEQQLQSAEAAAAANGEALAAAHAESEAQAGAGTRAAREAEEAAAARRLEITSLQQELRAAELALEDARGGEGNALGQRDQLVSSVAKLEADTAAKASELAALQHEHRELVAAHEALAGETAARTKLVDTLGATVRESKESAETTAAALSAELAKAEAMVRSLGDGRDAALAELSAEKVEHEACKMQLINVQATLQRHRADSTEMIATEGVRLTLALDELRRADRLAGVIHRSLHDAMRGAAEASGIVMPESAARAHASSALLAAAARVSPPREPLVPHGREPPQPGSTYSGVPVSAYDTHAAALVSTSAASSTSAALQGNARGGGLNFSHTPLTRRGGSPGPPPNSGASSVLAPGSASTSSRMGGAAPPSSQVTAGVPPMAAEPPPLSASRGSSPTGSERFRQGGVGAGRLSPPFASAAGRLSPETGTSRFGVDGLHAARRPTALGASASRPGAQDELGDLAARRAAMLSGRDPSEALAVGGGLAAAAEARAGLDVRGDGTVGTGFAAASEALGWLRNDSHQGRLEALRKKYGYEP